MRIALCGDSGVSTQPMRACSACAGDYEDPDRTAWTAETEEDEAHAEESARNRLQEATRDWAEDRAGDAGVNEEHMDDDEFPVKEA